MNLRPPRKKRSLQAVKLLYTPICFIFIFYFCWLNKELLLQLFNLADYRLIIAAAAAWALLHLLAPLGPKIVFAGMGNSIPYKELLTIHISRLPARYLPGGIWHTVGRLTDYHSRGITKKGLTVLTLIETFFPCLTTFLIGGGYLWLEGNSTILSNIEGTLALGSLVAIIMIPAIIRWRFHIHVQEKFIVHYLLLLTVTCLFWCIASISFLCYFSSVSMNLPQAPLLHTAASYVFSWGVGYISIFAPQGIGVFEVVAGKLMELPMTLGGAISFLAGFRVIALAGDGTAWLLMKIFQARQDWRGPDLPDTP